MPPREVRLRLLPRTEAARLLEGIGVPPAGLAWHHEYPTEDTVTAVALLLQAHRATGWEVSERPAWWLWQILLEEEVVGDVGFRGPPSDTSPATVELGYSVVPERRGRGIATAACWLLLAQAWADGAERVLAQAAADNPASRAVLRHAGFDPRADDWFEVRRP